MSRLFLIALGSILVGAALVGPATAAERHPAKPDRNASVQTPARTIDAYAAWPRPTPEVYAGLSSYYRGGYSAPAGR
ncbi:hypothetical protein [Bradyrhizobium viridifuturi]|uniref:hypothetical protein n=1 Tax=Bradyrhizobium viridifuturi TaxID=1654716 RepID=UPI00067E71B3|nr:hypothetical protein [Bradyrhizobium viridifuturi]